MRLSDEMFDHYAKFSDLDRQERRAGLKAAKGNQRRLALVELGSAPMVDRQGRPSMALEWKMLTHVSRSKTYPCASAKRDPRKRMAVAA